MAILAAGVGNLLKGDDGFGVRAAQALAADPRLPGSLTVIETGIGGMHLVQELMRGWDALIMFDAVDRGATPGALFLLEPEIPDGAAMPPREQRDFFADVHYATPIRALTLARSIGALPATVRIIGCQVARTDTFSTTMDPRVADAVPGAIDLALRAVAELNAAAGAP